MFTLVQMHRNVTIRWRGKKREKNRKNVAIINGNFMLHSLLYDWLHGK